MQSQYEVVQLKIGYARETILESGAVEYRADGSITLVKGEPNVLVDTGGPWDKEYLLQALRDHKLEVGDIEYVIGTHGHSDHIGNLNLFPSATFIVCFDICKGDHYTENKLSEAENFVINSELEVIATPGHTCSDVSLLVRNSQLGTVVVAGDLFECEADLEDPTIWQSNSLNPDTQNKNRERIVKIADYIVPGHGAIFKVQKKHKEPSL